MSIDKVTFVNTPLHSTEFSPWALPISSRRQLKMMTAKRDEAGLTLGSRARVSGCFGFWD